MFVYTLTSKIGAAFKNPGINNICRIKLGTIMMRLDRILRKMNSFIQKN